MHSIQHQKGKIIHHTSHIYTHKDTHLKEGELDPGREADEALLIRLGAVLEEVRQQRQQLVLALNEAVQRRFKSLIL